MQNSSIITLTVTCALLLALSDSQHPHIAEQPSTYVQASPADAANTAAPAVVSTNQ